MNLATFFPDAVIDDTGITFTWTGLGFPVSEEPTTENFYRALLFRLQQNVPTERVFDFSTSAMSLYTNPAQEVNSGTGSFLRTGWTTYFYSEFGINQLDPNTFVNEGGSSSPGPGPSPSPGPSPAAGVDPWTIIDVPTTNAAFGDRLWLVPGATDIVLPPHGSGGDLIIFNNTETTVSITDIPGEIIIPDDVSLLLASNGSSWKYYLHPSGTPGIVVPVNSNVVDISGSDPATTLPEDIFYLFGTNLGDTTWSNPLGGVRCAASSSSTSPTNLNFAADRNLNRFDADNTPGGWLAFDFDPSGNGTRVNLNAFAYQHISGFAGIRLQQFVVEAGDGADLASAAWTEVASINDPNFLPNTAGSWSTIRSLTARPSPYRFVRIRITGPDSSGGNNLSGSEVIFGGEIVLAN